MTDCDALLDMVIEELEDPYSAWSAAIETITAAREEARKLGAPADVLRRYDEWLAHAAELLMAVS